MRILQINTVLGFGSTGRTTNELAIELKNYGAESFCAYGQGKSNSPSSFRIGSRVENHLHNIFSRFLGNQGYYSSFGTKSLIKFIIKIKPDIIHLRNLHGNYLNLKILFNFLARSNIPVVWTLHDCWAFTGKCSHYTEAGCYRWQTFCHSCPQVHKYPPSLFLDRSQRMFQDKRKWVLSVDRITIITVSNWLAKEAKKSFLSKYPIISIYNWIDQKIFKIYDEDVRSKYGLPVNTPFVLGVSAGWGKSNSKLHDFIALSEILDRNVQLVLVGKEKENGCIPSGIKHIPFVKNPIELAKIYSIASVYVHLSVEDTFGKTIAEAMACGTPVVVYDATACSEVVGDGCGYVVEKRNIKKVADAVLNVISSGKSSFSEECIKHVADNFSYNRQISKTIQLYENILKYDC